MAVRAPNTVPAQADFREKFTRVEFACIGVGWATMLKKLARGSGGRRSEKTFSAVSSTERRGFAQIASVDLMKAEHSRRRAELLAKLEARALSCPGLYPVKTREDFLRLAMDHGSGGEESVCQILEVLWRRPDEALQMNAQSLIRRGQGLDQVGPPEKKGRQDQGAGSSTRQ